MSELTDPDVVIRALHFAAERQFRAKLLAPPAGVSLPPGSALVEVTIPGEHAHFLMGLELDGPTVKDFERTFWLVVDRTTGAVREIDRHRTRISP